MLARVQMESQVRALLRFQWRSRTVVGVMSVRRRSKKGKYWVYIR